MEIVIKNDEKWYQSRRIWGAILYLVILVGVLISPDQYQLLIGAGGLIASALGIHSWVAPKQ